MVLIILDPEIQKKSIEKQTQSQQSQLSGCKQVVESVLRDRRQCLMNSQTGHLGDESVRTVKLENNIEIPSLTTTITNYSTTQLGSANSVDSGKIRESMLVLIFASGQETS